MRKFFFFFSVFLISTTLVTTLGAQPTAQTLDLYFAEAAKAWEIPGMAIGIVKDGEVVLAKGYGVAEAGGSGKVDENTLFAIASNTKAFISAAIGILVEEGKLGWDDPVQKHLPYFALYDPYASAHATVRDLLSHRVGLGTFSGDVIWYKSNYTAEETVKHARFVPQDYEFRAGYGYTNLMFIAAGEVIKAVSGQTWDAFIRDRIFQPLGMDRTQTSVEPLAKMDNVATPHKPVAGKDQPIPWVNWDNMGAAGGIISSASDMLKWIQLQIDGGRYDGNSIFSEPTQIEFWHPHNNYKLDAKARQLLPSRHFAGYGLGWGIFDYGGRFVANHGGGYDGMYSKVFIVPEEKLGVVILTNTMKGISNPLMYYILDEYLGVKSDTDWSRRGLEQEKQGAAHRQERINERKEKRLPGTKPSLAPAEYAGTYYDPMFGKIEIRQEGEQLRLHFPAAPKLDADLSHWHLDVFEIQWDEVHAWFDFGTLQFELDNNGKVVGLRFDVPNDDIFFHEIRAKQ